VTAHQLVLNTGLQLDYAVFRGLVVISTSLQGIADVAQQSHPLSSDPGYRLALAGHPTVVTGLVYMALGKLLALGSATGLTSSTVFQAIATDLDKVTAVGLTTTRASDQSSSQITLAVP